ncbi:MAG: Nicotinamide-nucleotide amidohydrolase PncC [Steroidobacteraceae bacterium]|nr:Nicotinamide-nucleotide amidohydrolase PncC [Steroidobacteraceae bacterium]
MVTDATLFALAEAVGRQLLAARRRLVTAESCTAGWIAKALTDVAGSSSWFDCGYVTYSNDAKTRDLGVPTAVLARHGAVSEAAVRAMAEGALQRAGADIAVATSGIAGPDGGVPGKPVGTVWFAHAARRGGAIDTVARQRHFQGDREAVRRASVRFALELILEACARAAP